MKILPVFKSNQQPWRQALTQNLHLPAYELMSPNSFYETLIKGKLSPIKVPIASKYFILLSDPAFHTMKLGEKNFRFG